MSYREVARELGIRDTYIHNWKNAFEKDGTLAAEVNREVSETAELKRLREECRQLNMERESWSRLVLPTSSISRGDTKTGSSNRTGKPQAPV